jgi:hypothetical protein
MCRLNLKLSSTSALKYIKLLCYLITLFSIMLLEREFGKAITNGALLKILKILTFGMLSCMFVLKYRSFDCKCLSQWFVFDSSLAACFFGVACTK